MADPTTAELAKAIAGGSILEKWWFYVVWLLVTATRSALGVWLKEKVKGDFSKNIWLAQESWKEKYRLYTVLITEAEEIADALWNIVTDTRLLLQMPIDQKQHRTRWIKVVSGSSGTHQLRSKGN